MYDTAVQGCQLLSYICYRHDSSLHVKSSTLNAAANATASVWASQLMQVLQNMVQI